LARPNEPVDVATRDALEVAEEEVIESLPGHFRIDDDLCDRTV
jgi:hypothetical protein